MKINLFFPHLILYIGRCVCDCMGKVNGMVDNLQTQVVYVNNF